MKYYLDTEFHEYAKQPKLLGLNIGEPIDTIELISIGIVAEDDRESYAICKDFDLKAAWDNKWLRDSVLKNIYIEFGGYYNEEIDFYQMNSLLNCIGKTKKQIADEVKEFCLDKYIGIELSLSDNIYYIDNLPTKSLPEFYAYYADYDHVCLSWLYGRMIDLPEGFPMYCRDLKQELDNVVNKWRATIDAKEGKSSLPFDQALQYIQAGKSYPKQTNEHNALDDAKWNKRLHDFIKKL